MMLGISKIGDDWLAPSRKTLLYVSGPITPTLFAPSLEQNVEALYQKSAELFQMGYSVYCPAQEWLTKVWKAAKQAENNTSQLYEDVMDMDFHILSKCDAIVMIYGWRESKGAVREHDFAQKTGQLIVYQDIAPHDPVWDLEWWNWKRVE